MLHMPSPMLLSGATEDDLYPLFLANITTLAINGARPWSSGAISGGRYRVKPASGQGNMFGTTWNSYFVAGSALARAIQHALPSEGVFNSLVSSGHEVYIDYQTGTFLYEEAGPYGLNRNGYTSIDFTTGQYGETYGSAWIRDLIRFDSNTGKAWRSNPRFGSSETEYDFRT